MASLQQIVEHVQEEVSELTRKLELQSVWKTILESLQSKPVKSSSTSIPQSDMNDEVARVLTWLSLTAAKRTHHDNASLATTIAAVVQDGFAKTSDSLVQLMQENNTLRLRLHEVTAKELDVAEQLREARECTEQREMRIEELISLQR